ncbi:MULTISPECIES: MobF family relaxase [Phaeodactylibacter]|jgi:conjugative relaxase-like TrwC/TraI family protein|uniref:Conjugative relaxase n=1 Tax=Phaeodactylibacter luteus TaxID=1564516 RepID=A0A5C6RJ23_9BACT|nr:MobF family relaxase [Phaeodactylibacter luteus]TXB61352.1 conjugative relaxase [Phaeodactylibacter luteus]
MLRITVSKSAKGAVKYFDEGLSKSDYYAEKGEIVGQWHGKLAEQIGLSGEVQKEDFAALAYNQNPVTGEQLTARNTENRRVGYDFTFDVPKSVSLVYSQTKDEDILRAFNGAIQETMTEIEEHAATRVRSNGKNDNRLTENLAWATFTHEEARPVGGIPDPHLHQHVFVFNATYDQKEDRIKAAQFGDIKADAPYFETVFHSRLADKLQQVGYQIEPSDKHFELAGFERSTIDKFSNRTRQINDKAEQLGLSYDEDKAELGAKTRASKRTGFERDELAMQWRSRLTDRELELLVNAKDSPPTGGWDGSYRDRAIEKKKDRLSPKESVDYALDHVLERKSVVSEKELMTIGLQRGLGSVTPESFRNALEDRKDIRTKAIPNSKEILMTTAEAIQEERNLRNTTRRGKGAFEPIHPDYRIKNEQLTQEQASAVHHVLNSQDFITAVTGGAGTGKTWSIKEVAEGMKEKGVPFGAFAPSSAASRQVQREDGFENATTIAELLQSEKLQKSVQNGVIWVDEAGMVGNKTMNRIIDVAKEQNARILLTGDIKQHGSVERGDALRIIQQFGGVKPAEISKIQRQKNADYRTAVKAISNGNMEKGLQTLDQMGAIKEADSFDETRQKVAEEYATARKAKEDVLVVATTHAQGQAVTQTIRERLMEDGILQGDERIFKTQKNLSFTEVQKQDARSYQQGMIVQFHQNVKGGLKRGTKYQLSEKDENGDWVLSNGNNRNKTVLPLHESSKFSVYESQEMTIATGDKIRITQNGTSKDAKRLNNGNILEVTGFDKEGNILASSGKRSLTLSKDYGNLTHGYYTTSPASQGKSVNRVILLQSSMTGRAASKEQFYVSASRGKFAISIHTDDKQGLIRSVQRSSQRMTASEVATNPADRQKERMDKFKKMGQIFRAGLSRVAKTKEAWQNRSVGIISMITQKPQVVRNAPARGK